MLQMAAMVPFCWAVIVAALLFGYYKSRFYLLHCRTLAMSSAMALRTKLLQFVLAPALLGVHFLLLVGFFVSWLQASASQNGGFTARQHLCCALSLLVFTVGFVITGAYDSENHMPMHMCGVYIMISGGVYLLWSTLSWIELLLFGLGLAAGLGGHYRHESLWHAFGAPKWETLGGDGEEMVQQDPSGQTPPTGSSSSTKAETQSQTSTITTRNKDDVGGASTTITGAVDKTKLVQWMWFWGIVHGAGQWLMLYLVVHVDMRLAEAVSN